MSTFFGARPQADDDDENPVESLYTLSNNSKDVAADIVAGEPTLWFNIKETGGDNYTLTRVTIKPGPRAAAPAEEIVEIVAGGDGKVGEIEVDI